MPLRRRIHQLADRKRLESEIKVVLTEHRAQNGDLEASLAITRSSVSDLKDREKRAYLDHNNARSDNKRQMTLKIYDLRHAELAQAEEALNRLDSILALHGIGGEDQISPSTT
jgi:hypothetical protein